MAIARALGDGTLRGVLADEPTGNLDSQKSGDEIMALLRKLNDDSGITIVLVTHEDDVAAYAKRQVRFHDGKIVSDTARVSA